jgi:hypothetical protein
MPDYFDLNKRVALITGAAPRMPHYNPLLPTIIV